MKKQEQMREFLRLDKEGLQRELQRQRDKLRQFRFDLASGKVRDVRAIRVVKKNIARIMTILNSKFKSKVK